MSRTGSLWPKALALALCLGLITAAEAPRVEARDDEDEGGTKKKVVRVYTTGEDRDEETGAGYLGVQVQDLTRRLKRALDLEGVDGALVNRVEDESPAEKAGIKSGDVIVRVGRTDIADAGELTGAIRNMKPGENTSVVVVRDGDRKTLSVVLGARPKTMEFDLRGPDGGRWRWEGDAMPPGFMLRHQRDMEERMRDLQEEIARLTEEIRKLRLELERSSPRR